MFFQALRGNTVDINGDGFVNNDDPRRLVIAPVDIESTSVAAYGQLDYSLTDQLELVGGLRYTKDKKERVDGIGIGFEGGSVPAPNILPHDDGDKWSEVTGKLGLNYHISDDVMTYASYSTGYKAGGFNFTQDTSYEPETVDALEVGLKSQWLDNRLQMNVSMFYYDYEDKQDFKRIVSTAFSLFALQNASAVTITGLELEAQAFVTNAFQIDLSLSYLNAEFDDFETVDGDFPALGTQDLSGNKLPYSPEWKAHLGAQYEWALDPNAGSITARIDYSWVDDQWANGLNRKGDGLVLPGNGDFLPSYYIVNANVQWKSSGERWLAQFYAKNLTDEVVQTYSFIADSVLNATFLPPRTYGMKLAYNF